VSPRVCSHCGGPLPAGAHPSRTTCSRTCKEARYRAAKRERRREEARERTAKRVPRAAPKIDTDAIAASLTARERAIVTTWRDQR
jgi:predicted nucleic acid-binding Zn ribbon protein